MSRRPIAYLAHPVSGNVEVNARNAKAWLRYLVAHTPCAILAPWIPYVEALDDADKTTRDRGLEDDLLMMAGADAIILCGGKISNGMRLELAEAERRSMLVIDLTSFGYLPPYPGSDTHRRALIVLSSMISAISVDP